MEVGDKLYALTKGGDVKTWRCHVEENNDGTADLVITSQAKLTAKATVRRDTIRQGKNLGRSNETTVLEQALSEARSRYNKQADKGYSLDMPSKNATSNLNILGLPQPMLAHKLTDVKEEDLTFPAYWQPKLNGHRALVTKKDGKLIMYSRRGNLITTMDHILNEMDRFSIEEGMIFDGELYIHQEKLQNLTSLIKKKQSGSEQVEYHVYDMMGTESFENRMVNAKRVLEMDSIGRDYNSHVFFVATWKIHSLEMARKLTDECCEMSFEGGMLRLNSKGYEAGFRSRELLKMKKFLDEEFQVVNIKKGKTRQTNSTTLEVAILECTTKDGKLFDVTAPGTQFEKDGVWTFRDQYIGKWVTVQFAEWTKDGKPFHCVAQQFREDV